MYAVVELETTGMRTSWHDRVLEIAVVRLDESGRTIDEWCTLVNPDRDLGPQEIHGIIAAEARHAPRFADLAGQVAERLAGHTVVAHNLIFDAGFLTAEFAELGYQVPVEPGRGLCTMRLAGHFLPTAARSLQACRSAAGLGRHRAHSARHDARAAAELFAFYLRQAGRPAPWAALVDEAQRVRWPAMVRNDLPPVTRRRAEDREPHFLTRLVDRLPRLRDPQGDAYLDLLDRALLDRHISATEADHLAATADRLGLARADVEGLHRGYLTSLAVVALQDQVLTAAERRDLDAVAGLLGLTTGDVDRSPAEADGAAAPAREQWRLSAGDLVVFTGSMTPAREVWEETARRHGLDVGGNVTKKTRLLVAADPDTRSGKAKKARPAHPGGGRRTHPCALVLYSPDAAAPAHELKQIRALADGPNVQRPGDHPGLYLRVPVATWTTTCVFGNEMSSRRSKSAWAYRRRDRLSGRGRLILCPAGVQPGDR